AVVARLESRGFDPRETGPDSWVSRCPGHDGSRHNLSVTRGDDGRVLLHCHHAPGCSFEAIVQALGFDKADLFPRDDYRPAPSRNGKARPKAKAARCAHRTPEAAIRATARKLGDPTGEWTYHAADGTETFRVYRFDFADPKTGAPDKT